MSHYSYTRNTFYMLVGDRQSPKCAAQSFEWFTLQRDIEMAFFKAC